MKSLYARLSCLLLSLWLAPMLSQAQAFVPDPTHVYKLVPRSGNGDVLEVGGEDRYESGHWINGWGYWGGASQQWQFQDLGNGVFTIINRNSRQVLSTNPNGGENQVGNWSGDGIVTYQTDSRTSSLQEWQIYPMTFDISPTTGKPYYKIKNRYTGRVLEYLTPDQKSAARLRRSNFLWQWNETYDSNPNAHPYIGNQEFDIIDVSANLAQNPNRNVFRIVNRNSNKILSATAEDNGVSQESYRNLAGQEWYFTDYDSDGYLYIVNRNTNTVLEIGGGGDLGANGRTANLWDRWGGTNQQWALLDINDSHRLSIAEATDGRIIKIYNRNGGKVLEVADGRGDERAPAQQWNDFSLPWQQWYIQTASANRMAAPASAPTTAKVATDFSLYPNPAHGQLTLVLPTVKEVTTVRVTDMRGKLVPAPYLGNGKVDISNLATGIYLLTVSDGKQDYHQKFTKE
jgi:hypothetical protein